MTIMSEETQGLGQRELSVKTTFEELSVEEKDLLAKAAFDLLIDDVKDSGPKTINTAIGSLALVEKRDDAASGTDASSETGAEGAETGAEARDEDTASEEAAAGDQG